MSGYRRSSLVALAALAARGCGDPGSPNIPDLSDGSLQLFGMLVADSTNHFIQVNQTDSRPIQRLDAVLSEVRPDGGLTPLATTTVEGEGPGFTMVLEAVVLPGRRYQVTVTSPGHRTASAATSVPGDFTIDSLVAAGDPPGSAGLRATWNASAGGFRYIVNVRAKPDCQANVCETFGLPWAGVTVAPRLDTIIPATAIPPDRTDAVEMAVYAVNRDMFEYFTTGVGGTFTVQPKQNVAGGYGVLGAWVRRERVIRRQDR
ncbi:MAG: hypothetical protein ACREMX_08150 [Gemmatimonadales bacterium]